MPSTETSEARSLKSVGDVQEGYLKEAKYSETPFAIEESNTRIVEHVNNGLLPEQIDKRLESELQQPVVQRQLIKEFSSYSDEINFHIKTTKELSVYSRNDLQESKILDRPCLQLDIDPERTDAMGRSNMERMAAGRAPVDANGDPINLHHIGQKVNAPLAELPDRVHKENDAILHERSVPTEVHGEGNNWNQERCQYWRERSATL